MVDPGNHFPAGILELNGFNGGVPLVEVRRVRADEWEALRETRLRALADAPDAFGTTHAEARAHPEQWWRDRAERTAAGDAQAMFLAWDGDRAVGIARRVPGGVALSGHLDVDRTRAPGARRRP